MEKTRSYYDAEGRLRVVDRRTCVYSPTTVLACNPAPAESRATFEEYRYDPLGRRILTRTNQDWHCATNCVSGLTRTVWDGDRVLHEIRAPSAAMERDSGWSHGNPAAKHYGRVSYLFGGALDHPLALYRLYHDTLFVSPGYEGLPGSPVAVLPRTNWRGDYDMGFFAGKGPTHKLADGKPAWCVTVPLEEYDHEPVEEENEEIMPTTSICAEIDWPAEHLWMTHRARPTGPAGSYSWWGSLIHNKRDLTGQLYMRNRYYDPAAARFTQEDPIGLAGGVNLYGFAGGDPVSFSDPYGLCIWLWLKRCREVSSRFTKGDVYNAAGNLLTGDLNALFATVQVQRLARSGLAQRRGQLGSGSLGAARANGWRHIFGACYLAEKTSRAEAQRTTYAHEIRIRDSDPDQARDSRQDHTNNAIGINAESDPQYEGQTCQERADDKIATGHYAGEGGIYGVDGDVPWDPHN